MKRKGRVTRIDGVVVRTRWVSEAGMWQHSVVTPEFVQRDLVEGRERAMDWHGCDRVHFRVTRHFDREVRPLPVRFGTRRVGRRHVR